MLIYFLREFIMQKKPRNHVALALMQRNSGSGVHQKTNKALRKTANQELRKQVKKAKNNLADIFSFFHFRALFS